MALSSRFDPRTRARCAASLRPQRCTSPCCSAIMLGGSQYGIDSGDSPTSQARAGWKHRTPSSATASICRRCPPARRRRAKSSSKRRWRRLAPPPSEAIEDQAVEPARSKQLRAPCRPARLRSWPARSRRRRSRCRPSERASLSRRLEQLAEQALKSSRTEVTWEQDGRQYSALLIRERANEGTALERVIAQVSAVGSRQAADDAGEPQSPRVLAVHADGRSLGSDGAAARRRDRRPLPHELALQPAVRLAHGAEIPRQGDDHGAQLQHGIDRAAPRFRHLPRRLRDRARATSSCRSRSQPFEWAPRDERARVHEFAQRHAHPVLRRRQLSLDRSRDTTQSQVSERAGRASGVFHRDAQGGAARAGRRRRQGAASIRRGAS